MKEYFDFGSAVIIVITFILFIIALFVKGLTQDLLLEAGIFLVSVKIIMLSYRNSVYTRTLAKELNEIKEILQNK